MNILILSNSNENTPNTIERQLTEELSSRGHLVQLLQTDDLEQHFFQRENHPSQKLLKGFLSKQHHQRMERILVPALKEHLSAHCYDAVISTQIFSAEIMSRFMEDNGHFSAFTALIYTENQWPSSCVQLSCDEYIVMSKQAIRTMIDGGVAGKQIHLVQPSDHAVKELCSLLEELMQQWSELLAALHAEH